ncbi:hypothetical protein JANAI62_23520 [Jannaschia pagri]|uniref:Ribbon-helix-helix domain-containing protein n=2 Tax=Jannaschia TaxID=188905 RepID=A0ABQ4NNB6_9RHOB|nr:hypothetical protein JANAI61_23530 [Jannaschia sp. AI_61]GIT95729.1 hypothetical protein JANAI62_23520 [Jannaschia sp. AI_62]
MAKARGLSINALAAKIDRQRGASAGLASAIRVAVLIDLQQSLGVEGLFDDDTGQPMAIGITDLQIDGSDGA